jgi:hypothetical protein
MSVSSGHQVINVEVFATSEWHRITRLYDKLIPGFTLSLQQFVTQRDEKLLTTAVDRVVVEVGSRTARTYGIGFSAPTYIKMSDKMTSDLIKIIFPPKFEQAVGRILPRSLSLGERGARLGVLTGLSLRDAIRVERWRQGNPERGTEVLGRAIDLRNRRINLIARTEVPRIAMNVMDSLWFAALEPEVIAKGASAVGRPFYSSDLAISGGVIPRYARKYWVTRRDGKVCQYCLPLEGVTTLVGMPFNTIYGTFSGPPIHPECRCVPILSAKGRP